MARRRTAAGRLIALALYGAGLAGCAPIAPPMAPAQAAGASAPGNPAPAPAPAPAYTLDPTHTFVHWEVLHMGTSTIRGRFGPSRGTIAFDAGAQRLEIGIEIDTDTVDSGVPLLDKQLRGSSILDSATYPQATFSARNARFEEGAPREIRGELTLRGISHPLTLRALRWKCGLNLLFGRTVCGGDFEADINRSVFGITHSLPFVADHVRLLVQVEAIAPR